MQTASEIERMCYYETPGVKQFELIIANGEKIQKWALFENIHQFFSLPEDLEGICTAILVLVL